MPWPPTPNAAFNISGRTTIKWGTDGMYSTYFVKSITDTDEAERVYVENGTGLKSTRIMLMQGRGVDITVVDDSNIAPPRINTTVTVTDQLAGANTLFTVVERNGSASRKEAADLIIHAEYLTNIEGGGTPPTNMV